MQLAVALARPMLLCGPSLITIAHVLLLCSFMHLQQAILQPGAFNGCVVMNSLLDSKHVFCLGLGLTISPSKTEEGRKVY